MEGLDTLIRDLAYILVVAGVTTLIFKKIKQPVVLGYIVAGFITGPYCSFFPSILGKADITVWADMGIIFIMFALGLEFSFHKIANVGGSAIVTATTVIGAMVLIGYFVGTAMGWSRMDCIFLGGMISMSSTSIILKAYEEMNLKKEKFAGLVLGALVLEDIAGIFMMIILSTISISQNVDGLGMIKEISVLLLYLVLWLVLGIFLIPSFLKKSDSLMNDETLLVVSIGLCLGMVVLANVIGFSSALGAFVAGSILAGTVKAEQIEHLVQPIKDLFAAVFFIHVGMMVVPEMLVKYWMPILLLSIVVIVGQNIFSTIGVLLSGQSLHTAVRAGFSMVQIGEFSFIIATLGTSLGVTSDFLYPIIVCVSVITTFTTPIFIKNGEKAYGALCKVLPDKIVNLLNRYTSEGQVDHDKDQDWKTYIGRYFLKTVICVALLFAIYTLSKFYAVPLLYKFFPSYGGGFLEAVITIALMSPFISILCSTRKSLLYKKLWIKHPANRLPLMAFNVIRIFIAMAFLGLSLKSVFAIPTGVITLIAFVVVFIMGRSEMLTSASLRLQAQFVANFNERAIAKLRKERNMENTDWLDKKLFIVEFTITGLPEHGSSIKDFTAKKKFGVDIVRIKRQNKYIILPEADQQVEAGDIICAMGQKEQIDSYLVMLEQAEYIDEPKEERITLNDFILNQASDGVNPEDQIMVCGIAIKRGGRFDRKSIKNCGFRKKFGGYIICMESGNLCVISPPRNFVIRAGDIMWVIGNAEMAAMLYADGYLDAVDREDIEGEISEEAVA